MKIYRNLSLLFAIVLMMSSYNVLAQNPLVIKDGHIEIDDQRQDAVHVLLEPSPKSVKKALKKWMQNQYDVDVDGYGFLTNKDVLKIEKAEIPAISNKAIDWNAKIVESDKGSEMLVYASFGYDVPVDESTYPRAYEQLRMTTLAFLEDYLPEYYTDRIEEKKEVIEDVNEDITDLNDNTESNKKTIEELRAENEALRAELSDNRTKMQDLESELQLREKEYRQVKSTLDEAAESNK